jgi:hypothetical protein
MMQAPNRQILRGARANDIPVERSTRFEFVINLKTAKVLRQGLRQILEWCHEIEPAEGVGLNVILTDGEQKVGSRFGRTLYYVEGRECVTAKSAASRSPQPGQSFSFTRLRDPLAVTKAFLRQVARLGFKGLWFHDLRGSMPRYYSIAVCRCTRLRSGSAMIRRCCCETTRSGRARSTLRQPMPSAICCAVSWPERCLGPSWGQGSKTLPNCSLLV